MRKVVAIVTVGAAVLVGSASSAGAEHTGCEHSNTQQAHASVPHHTEGNHNAHQRIPYCPPEDAPRQGG